ncbi:hypothetical protein CPB84DRAFT_1850784 [Gymnopilus junonius]|uniref:Uncharacterized protein n=1 Tax=Gymnopilus junonius TaxID=109634 RepID=A0A9P5NHN8_GYMJU|nr:hypothetical protein CPB84DRAFT_1850784 [Gymnopilus junonius]
MSCDIKEIWEMSCKQLAMLLQGILGKIHLVADGWMSPNAILFIGVTVQFVDNGKIRSIVLDFIKAMKAHTGIYLAAWISECLHVYGIQNMAILSPFSHKLKESTGAEDDEDPAGANVEIKKELEALQAKLSSLDGIGNEELQVDDEADEIAPDVAASDAAAIRGTIFDAMSIAKLHALGVKIVNSPTVSEDLKQCCKNANIKPKQMIHNIAILILMVEHNKPRGVHLGRFKLALEEWDLLKRPGPLLDICSSFSVIISSLIPCQIFLYATKKISTNKIPLIHQVIPIFDTIMTALEDNISNTTLPAIICHAALWGNHHDPPSLLQAFLFFPSEPATTVASTSESLTTTHFAATSKCFDVLNDKSAPVNPLKDWLSTPIVIQSKI